MDCRKAGIWHHAVDVDAQLHDQPDAVGLIGVDRPVDQIDAAVRSELVEKGRIVREPGTHLVAAAFDACEGKCLDGVELDFRRALFQQVSAIASWPARSASSYGVRPLRMPGVLRSTPCSTSSFTRSKKPFFAADHNSSTSIRVGL